MNKGFQWVKRVKATCYQLFRGKHFCLFRQDKKATLYIYKYICKKQKAQVKPFGSTYAHSGAQQKKQVQKVLASFVLMIFKQFLDCGYRCVI